jgi:peptidoglycan hydrolase CwlO-like protein
MEPNIQTAAPRSVDRTARRSKSSVPLFLAVWVLLIGCGVIGTVWYTGQMKAKLTQDISAQTARQITAMQQNYDAQLKQMQTQFAGDLSKVQGKVDALNELLQFTKDNTNSKTDNSNKLFSQLSEVEKKLAELQKSLDVLK